MKISMENFRRSNKFLRPWIQTGCDETAAGPPGPPGPPGPSGTSEVNGFEELRVLRVVRKEGRQLAELHLVPASKH
jgi:hypothetical protein